MDGTDCDTLWIGSEEDRNVRSECEEHEGTDSGDSNRLRCMESDMALCLSV